MQAALVGEGRIADVGGAAVGGPVEALVDEARDVGKLGQAFFRDPGLVPHLDHQGGQEAHQVGVAATLAEAVHGALHLAHAETHGGQAVGHGIAGVVVAVDAEVGARDVLQRRADGALDLVGQGAAVGVAEHDPARPGGVGGLDAIQRVGGVGFVAVEEVLGIEHGLVRTADRQRHAVGDHVDVLRPGDAKRHVDVEVPGLGDQADGIGLGAEQGGEPGIVFRAAAGAPRHAEGGELGVGESGGLGEERVVGGVGAGPARLHVIDAEAVQLPGDRQLVGGAEVDPLGLGAVAQRGIVKVDALVAHDAFNFHQLREARRMTNLRPALKAFGRPVVGQFGDIRSWGYSGPF